MRRWIAGIVAAVAAAVCVCAAAAVPRTVPGTIPGTVPRTVPGTDDHAGKAAYAKACESCHGAEAKGGTAPGLLPFTLELSELIAIVRQGIGVMPGIPRDRISDAEIAAIRDYLISLKN